jgi:hypothetical protein
MKWNGFIAMNWSVESFVSASNEDEVANVGQKL